MAGVVVVVGYQTVYDQNGTRCGGDIKAATSCSVMEEDEEGGTGHSGMEKTPIIKTTFSGSHNIALRKFQG